MSVVFNGRCHCGAVQFESSHEPIFQRNCHCDDCRRLSGSAYASYVFIPAEALAVSGTVQQYQHKSDRGRTMTKYFCGNCGTQLFNANSAHPQRKGVRVGAIDDASWFRPDANVYCSRKLPSTPLDPSIKAYDEMPE